MEFKYIDTDGCSWLDYEGYVFYQFGYSAYSDLTRESVIQTLKELWDTQGSDRHYFIRDSEGFEYAFQELLLGILSHANITEYGTSPRASWLTDKGKKLLAPMFEGGEK